VLSDQADKILNKSYIDLDTIKTRLRRKCFLILKL